MDTFVQVKVSEPGVPRGEMKQAVDEAFELAGRLQKKFDAFDPASEVNALNIAGTKKVSRELYGLIKEAKRISYLTGGEFDITVAPVMKANGLYGNMPAELREKVPGSFEGVGWKNVSLRLDGSIMLRKGAWVDLSGIAKGYIVDRMTGALKGKGIEEFMINAGGDIYCAGRGAGSSWKIGVRAPGAKGVVTALDIKGRAVATSGDYENVVLGGDGQEKISHIIDPVHDRAMEEVPSSVTVIAPTCAEADAFATGMMAMGGKRAIRLADTLEGVEIIVVKSPGGKMSVDYSKDAKKYVSGVK